MSSSGGFSNLPAREWVSVLPTALRQELLLRAARTLLLTIGRYTRQAPASN